MKYLTASSLCYALVLVFLVNAGCVAYKSAAPVAANQQAALTLVASESARDAATTRRLAEALFKINRATTIGDLDRELILSGLLNESGPDLAALDADLALATPKTTLGRDVRAGLITRAQAVALLSDLHAVNALSDGPARRRELLATLSPVREADALSASTLAGLDARARSLALVVGSASEDGTALAYSLSPSPTLDVGAAATGTLSAFPAGPRRDALSGLLDSLLARYAPAPGSPSR